ncbi:MAG: T9SS type A sorting domain-containing protein [Flavobacteriaceae bacterium]|jgi:hypothetical protein|nr:T9SS type A sorting domain-containing protein [Flavobacteriaceae bacterium]
MLKKYFTYFTLLILCVFTLTAVAQSKGNQTPTDTKYSTNASIEGLSIYPNPVYTNSKVTIETAKNDTKEIELYNLVGKRMFAITTGSRDIMLPNSITPGVYIIKVKENNASATRKIVVK